MALTKTILPFCLPIAVDRWSRHFMTKGIPHGIKVSIMRDTAYVGNKAFSPNPVKIKTADTITWIDNDIETHTVTSGAGSNEHSVGKLFDSGILNYAQSFSHTFNTRG